jgi:hypothetical protein
MVSSGMSRHVALVRTDVSEELSASFIRVTRTGELGTTLAVTSNRRTLVFLRSMCQLLVTTSVVPSSPILITLMKEALSSSKTLVLTRATRCNIPEDTILHAQTCCNSEDYHLDGKSYWHFRGINCLYLPSYPKLPSQQPQILHFYDRLVILSASAIQDFCLIFCGHACHKT